ncbi:uncharacterized protein LOC135925162 isoform X2 [Gordionus sp. m RMFG-2023]|uniref:uncharacterized protein LOC135925162 isoform X2 n=1 Tax=Gordionus sp. m RMFG-2023 TaxID=3053472 RepID=UPI0031FC597C
MKYNTFSGHFAVVRRCKSKIDGQEYAAKFIRKKRAQASRRGLSMEDIKREVGILQELDSHPNVITLKEVFDNSSNVILVLELVKGGELFDILLENRFLHDREASQYVKQILQGLGHLHSKHIGHLDLKPENIMIKDKTTNDIKIIDFGLARKLKGTNVPREMMGTPEFVAPEIINFDPISLATDMWSLGVITYILLSGASPFLGSNRQETFENIVKIDFSFDDEYFSKVSQGAKNFITKLLVSDPRKRLTVKECLNHSWIKGSSPLKSLQYLPLITPNLVSLDNTHDIDNCNNNNNHNFNVSNISNEIHSYGNDKNGKHIDLILKADTPTNIEFNNKALEDPTRAKDSHETSEDENLEYSLVAHNTVIGYDSDRNTDLFNNVNKTIRYSWQKSAKLVIIYLRLFNEIPVDEYLSLFKANKALYANFSLLKSHQKVLTIMEQIGKETLFAAFLCACKSGNLLAVQELFALTSIDLNSLSDDEGESGIIMAIKYGYLDIVKFLHSQKIDIHAKNKHEETCLFSAVKNGHLLILQFLLDIGCDVNHKNKNGETCLHVAINLCLTDVVEIICRHPSTDPNIQDQLGDSPLHLAVWHDLVSIVHILCCNSAININIQNKKGETPFHISASQINGSACLKRLQEAQISSDSLNIGCTEYGFTPLHCAIAKLNITCALMLIDAGCTLDRPDRNGNMPIHLACKEGLLIVIQTLCAYGCKVNVPNFKGFYPIHIAARYGKLEICRCLCLACCDISVRIGLICNSFTSTIDNAHMSLNACELAISYGHQKVADLLGKLMEHDTETLDDVKETKNGCNSIKHRLSFKAVKKIPNLNNRPIKSNSTSYPRAHSIHARFISQLLPLTDDSSEDGFVTSLKSEFNNRIKLKILGEPGSGKTAFTLRLRSPPAFLANLSPVSSPLRRLSRNSRKNLSNYSFAKYKNNEENLSYGDGKDICEANGPSGRGATNIVRSASQVNYRFKIDLRSNPNSNALETKKRRSFYNRLRQGSFSHNHENNINNPNNNLFSKLANNPITNFYNHHYRGSSCEDIKNYIPTQGIFVQNINLPGAGEYSAWDFSGNPIYRQVYDHFIGDIHSVHAIVFDASQSLACILKDIFYWCDFLRARFNNNIADQYLKDREGNSLTRNLLNHQGRNRKRIPLIIIGTRLDKLLAPATIPSLEILRKQILSRINQSIPRLILDFDLFPKIFFLNCKIVPDITLNNNCGTMNANFNGNSSSANSNYNCKSNNQNDGDYNHNGNQEEHCFSSLNNTVANGLIVDNFINTEWLELMEYLEHSKYQIVQKLPKATGLLQNTLSALNSWRKLYGNCPVMPWPLFIEHIHQYVNCLASFDHLKELITQLQFMGEVLYIKCPSKRDLVVMDPAWLCSDIIGKLFVYQNDQIDNYVVPRLNIDEIAYAFREFDIVELLPLLEALQLCTQYQNSTYFVDYNQDHRNKPEQNRVDRKESTIEYEFNCLNSQVFGRLINQGLCSDVMTKFCLPAFSYPLKNLGEMLYGGYRILPVISDNVKCFQTNNTQLLDIFPRIQNRFRSILQEHADEEHNGLLQYATGSKLISDTLECLVNIIPLPNYNLATDKFVIYEKNSDPNNTDSSDVVYCLDILAKGPANINSTLFYFLNDVVDIVEDVTSSALPSTPFRRSVFDPISLKKFFFSRPENSGNYAKNYSSCSQDYHTDSTYRLDLDCEENNPELRKKIFNIYLAIPCYSAKDLYQSHLSISRGALGDVIKDDKGLWFQNCSKKYTDINLPINHLKTNINQSANINDKPFEANELEIYNGIDNKVCLSNSPDDLNFDSRHDWNDSYSIYNTVDFVSTENDSTIYDTHHSLNIDRKNDRDSVITKNDIQTSYDKDHYKIKISESAPINNEGSHKILKVNINSNDEYNLESSNEQTNHTTLLSRSCWNSRDIQSIITPWWELPFFSNHFSNFPTPCYLTGNECEYQYPNIVKRLCFELDIADPLGKDWCLFAVSLGLASILPILDSCRHNGISAVNKENTFDECCGHSEKVINEIFISDLYLDQSGIETDNKHDAAYCDLVSDIDLNNVNKKNNDGQTDSQTNHNQESPTPDFSKTQLIINEWHKHTNDETYEINHMINKLSNNQRTSPNYRLNKTLGNLVKLLSMPCDRQDLVEALFQLVPLFAITSREE